MVRVANSAKLDFREALATAEVRTSFTDDQIAQLIIDFREKLNAGRPSTVAEESQLMASAIRPLYDALLGAADLTSFDTDQLGALFWDLYAACTANTRSALRCPELNDYEEAWADMVSLVLSTPEVSESVVTNPCGSRIAVVGGLPCLQSSLRACPRASISIVSSLDSLVALRVAL